MRIVKDSGEPCAFHQEVYNLRQLHLKGRIASFALLKVGIVINSTGGEYTARLSPHVKSKSRENCQLLRRSALVWNRPRNEESTLIGGDATGYRLRPWLSRSIPRHHSRAFRHHRQNRPDLVDREVDVARLVCIRD